MDLGTALLLSAYLVPGPGCHSAFKVLCMMVRGSCNGLESCHADLTKCHSSSTVETVSLPAWCNVSFVVAALTVHAV